MEKIGKKVRLEGKHAMPRHRGKTGTLVNISRWLQFPYSVRLKGEDRIVQAKEKALSFPDADTASPSHEDYEDYEEVPWTKGMDPILTPEQKRTLINRDE
jgi:hypothetical protein